MVVSVSRKRFLSISLHNRKEAASQFWKLFFSPLSTSPPTQMWRYEKVPDCLLISSSVFTCICCFWAYTKVSNRKTNSFWHEKFSVFLALLTPGSKFYPGRPAGYPNSWQLAVIWLYCRGKKTCMTRPCWAHNNALWNTTKQSEIIVKKKYLLKLYKK